MFWDSSLSLPLSSYQHFPPVLTVDVSPYVRAKWNQMIVPSSFDHPSRSFFYQHTGILVISWMYFPSVRSTLRRSSLPLHSEVSLLLPGKLNSRSFFHEDACSFIPLLQKRNNVDLPFTTLTMYYYLNSNTPAHCSFIFDTQTRKEKKNPTRKIDHTLQ